MDREKDVKIKKLVENFLKDGKESEHDLKSKKKT